MNVYIYTLANPITNEIRYIGKTNNIKKRLIGHLLDKDKSWKNNWIKSLTNKGLKPKIEVLDIVKEEEWEFWEQYWICQVKAWGLDLVNSDNGGLNNQRFTKESKEKAVNHVKSYLTPNRKKYAQYTYAGELVSTYSTIEDLRKEHPKYVNNFIKNGWKGFLWRSFKLNEVIPKNIKSAWINPENKIRKILQFNLDNSFVKEHENLSQAAKAISNGKDSVRGSVSNIWSVCNFKTKSAKGFIWRYES